MKTVNKEIRNYKRRLLLESIFPIFSRNVHSIPDVAGPAKLYMDIALIIGIVVTIQSGGYIPYMFGTLLLGSLSTITTVALYKIDFNENVIEEIKQKSINEKQEDIYQEKSDYEYVSQKKLNNDKIQKSNSISNDLFYNEYASEVTNNKVKKRVLTRKNK